MVRVSADSSSDAWAIAYDLAEVDLLGSPYRWNGRVWKAAPAPTVRGRPLELADVDALSPSNVWSVGATAADAAVPYASHWTGATWASTALPTPGTGPRYEYRAVAAVPGGKDVWAVGSDGKQAHPEAALFDGTSWKQASVPAAAGTWHQVVARTLSDAWAVGRSRNDSRPQLIAHWNGGAWTYVADANATAEISEAVGYVPGTNHVWVVGSAFNGGQREMPFAEIWNGKTWTRTSVPAPSNGGDLVGVAALSPTDAWAVGWATDSDAYPVAMLTYHWNGKTWTSVAPPRTTRRYPQLLDVAAVPSGDVWAVGGEGPLENPSPIVLHRAP